MFGKKKKDKEKDNKDAAPAKKSRSKNSKESSGFSGPNSQKNLPTVYQEVANPLQLSHTDTDLTSSHGLIRQQIHRAKEIADSISSQWKRIAREGDVEEFLFTVELTTHSLERLESVLQPSLGLSHKLKQFIELLEDYDGELKQQGEKKLSAMVNSLLRRRPLVQFNSRVQNELKFVLGASGAATHGHATIDPKWIRKRSLGRFSSVEGRDFWRDSFTALEMENVPWGRFIQCFQACLPFRLDLADERILKHILDNDNVGVVTPTTFNYFLKTFGPLSRSMINLKALFEFRWFHGYLSVEEVVRLLVDQPVGTYLVRFSRSKPDAFVLEYVESKGRIRTVEVKCDLPHGVSLAEANNQTKTFPSIEALIVHYTEAGLLKIPFHFDLAHKNWFYGEFTQAEAEAVLALRPPGTFLLRFADNGRFQYIASYVAEGGPGGTSTVQHSEITKSAGGYSIDFMPASHAIKPEDDSDVVPVVEPAPILPESLPPPIILSSSNGSENSSSAPASPILPPPIAQFNLSIDSSAIPSIEIESPHQTSHTALNDLPSPSQLYPSLADLIFACKRVLRFNYDPEKVPRLQLADFWEMERHVDLRGPLLVDGKGVRCEPFPQICAQTVATYPAGSYGWQIVCDQFYARVMGNRTVFALADGCGWGSRPREAAIRASETIVEQIADRTVQLKINDTIDCKTVLLRSFNVAHQAIIQGKEDVFMAGTSTLLAGIFAEVDTERNEWAAVIVSVGDCKCYVYNTLTETVTDVTMGNRSNLHDGRDPGGRLGPYFESGDPDLRNLAAYFWPMHAGDLLFAVSDGVHDNVEPEALGKTPYEAATFLKTTRHASIANQVPSDAIWDQMDQILAEKIKTAHMTTRLEQIIAAIPPEHRTNNSNNIVGQLVTATLKNSIDTTLPSREFMEKNPEKPEPDNHALFPGKMDHTTCVAIRAELVLPRDRMRLAKNPRPKLGISISATNTPLGGSMPGMMSLSLSGSATVGGGNAAASSSSSSSASRAVGDREKHRGVLLGSAPVFNNNNGSRDDLRAASSPHVNISGIGPHQHHDGIAHVHSASTTRLQTSNVASPRVPPLTGTSPQGGDLQLGLGGLSLKSPRTGASPPTPIGLKFDATAAAAASAAAPPASPRGGGAPNSPRKLATAPAPVLSFETVGEPLIDQITTAPVAKYSVDFLKVLKGPLHESEHKFGPNASIVSISTFPAIIEPDGKKVRFADPNTNHYSVELTPNRLLAVLTVGSSFGSQSHSASLSSNRICFDSLSSFHMDIDTVQRAAHSMLRAFDMAHRALIAGNGATAALLAALMLRGTSGSRFWNLVIGSVGNCKAMSYNTSSNVVRDLTQENTSWDRNDSGGCVGPSDKNNNPDMRNFLIQHALVEEGEIAFFLSPDAAANFDPELLGVPLQSLVPNAEPGATWSNRGSTPAQVIVQAKDEFRCRELSRLLTQHICTSASKLTAAVIEFCISKTSPTRRLMEADPTANEPTDYQKFPGKMGHITCVSFRVGPFTDHDAEHANSPQYEMMSTVFTPLSGPTRYL